MTRPPKNNASACRSSAGYPASENRGPQDTAPQRHKGFVFLALTIEVVLILVAGRRVPALNWLGPLAIGTYHFNSLRRVFGGSRLTTARKGTLLLIVYMLVIMSTMVAVGFSSLKGTGPGKPQTEVAAPHP